MARRKNKITWDLIVFPILAVSSFLYGITCQGGLECVGQVFLGLLLVFIFSLIGLIILIVKIAKKEQIHIYGRFWGVIYLIVVIFVVIGLMGSLS